MSVQVQLDDKNQPVPVRVTHNNDRQHYVIAIDIAKEGGQLWDLTPYFKGRVGDSNFGLQVVWYYQGRLMDLTNKTPYIEGNVGEYSFDDNKEIQMAPDASVVSYTGDSSDCESGGRATYYFPEQMFPKSGAFKGFIGVRDDTGKTAHVSGVTIWFKVLPGAAQMGHACDFYVHDLEVALANANEKTREQLNDANTKLNNQLADANDKLTKAQTNFDNVTAQALQDVRDKYKQEVQANEDMSAQTRANLSQLADTVGEIEARIKADDIITKKEFNAQIDDLQLKQQDVATQIKEQLSKIQVKTKVFGTFDELKKAYPNGDSGLFLITADQHWYYYDGTAWVDGGAYNGTKLDFSNVSGGYYNLLEGTSNQKKAFNGEQYMIVTTSTNGDNLTSLQPGQKYTYAVNASEQNGTVYMEVLQFNADNAQIKRDTWDINVDGSRTRLVFTVDPAAVKVQTHLVTKDTGTTNFTVANETLLSGSQDNGWRKSLNDYSLPEAIDKLIELHEINAADKLADISNGTNLLKDTSDEYKPFNINNWDMVTTASNGSKLSLIPGETYTYSASIKGLSASSPVALKVRGIDDGNPYFRTNAITQDGTYSLTFTVPEDCNELLSVSVGTFQNLTDTFLIKIANEQLQHGSYATKYHSVATSSVLEDTAKAIRDSSGVDYQAIQDKFPYFNLLLGTTEEDQTFVGTGWGEFTTAKNAVNLKLPVGKTYTYQANVEASKGTVSVQAFFFDKDNNKLSFVRSSYGKGPGKQSLTFTVPDKTDHVNVVCVFGQSDADNNVMTISHEALFEGSNSLDWCKAVNECSQGEILRRLLITSKINKNSIQDKLPYFNLLTGTSSKEQTFIGTGWGRNSTASNSGALNLTPGQDYTYSANLDVTKGTASLQIFFYDDNGTQSSFLATDYQQYHDKVSYTFSVPTGVHSAGVAIVFGKSNDTDNSVKVKNECLFIGDYPWPYIKSIDECDLDEVFSQIVKCSQLDTEEVEETFPYFNLLVGTSSEPETFTGAGWTQHTTASNSKNLHLTVGETYTYASDIKCTKGTAGAQVFFYKADGSNTYQAADYVSGPARSVITFTVPKDTVTTNVITVFSNPDSTVTDYSMTISNESLYHANHDLGYMPNPSEMTEAKVLKTILDHTQIASSSTNLNDATVTHLPVLTVNGDSSDLLTNNTESTLPFVFNQDGNTMNGYLDMQWQGNTSLSYPKKGFKAKFFEDADKTKKLKFKPSPLFYKSNNFHLKAYYTNYYNVNDAIVAEIYSRLIANDENAPVELQQANHYGTIQSTPVMLYFKDQFYGLMEFCTKSSSDLWNMDKKNADQIAIEANTNSDYGNFVAKGGTFTKDGDFELQSDNDQNAQTALTNLQDLLVVDDDATFKNNVASHFDENSLADAIISNWICNNSDGWNGKNQCFLTYDNGEHWYWMAYDFDSSFGSSWKPGTIYADDRDYFTDPDQFHNKALKRWATLNPDKLLNRFNQLESLGALNVPELQSIIRNKIAEVGEPAYKKEHERWSGNPVYQTDKLNVDHMCYMLSLRKRLLKQKLEDMSKPATN